MFEIGDKVKWNGAEVTIMNRGEMNTSKGIVYRYDFVSPTGNYMNGIPDYELTE